MKNYKQSGKSVTVTVGATITGGQAILIGAILGIAFKAGVSGDDIEFSTEGVYDIPKAAGAITQGAKCYWDDTAKNITTTASGNTHIGYCWYAAASGDATVSVKLGI
jgi:predicted RecA/RadA family phage recombinase